MSYSSLLWRFNARGRGFNLVKWKETQTAHSFTCWACLRLQAQASVSQKLPIPSSKLVLWKNEWCARQFSGEKSPQNSELTDSTYEEVSEETLDSLTEKFEDLAEENFTSDSYDVNYASGVITIKLGEPHGTYVINKQAPNKQIWFSSPVSGPKRYDFVDGTWVYKYDDLSLHRRLSEELSEMFNTPIDFTDCSYGKLRSL